MQHDAPIVRSKEVSVSL